ncbi:histidinol-phosphate transaminase [Coleofasciculus sp. H7-2]|uniref:histidinol-phosphate transaminase n=1 Tax=Coleofasciculus sp. H7-2 TaxID=3351545 RepID=UPI0036709CA9
MLSFIRSDLSQLRAYMPHPGGTSGSPVAGSIPIDRLDTNECPFDLPKELKEKLAWTYQQLIETNRYPDGSHAQLKEAIAQYANQSLDAPITPASISVGNGSDELIRSLLIATCLGKEGAILVADPTFSMYAILAKTLGIPVVSVGRKEANFEMDLAAAQKAIEETQNPPIRVVFVVHPNSPTANALTAAELEWLRSLPEHILVVIDEAYFEFSQTTVVGELPQRPNWVVLRTFSKAFRLAALRLGYALAHPELIVALEKVRLPYNLPSFTQAAALLALSQQQLLLSCIPQILTERDKLLDFLKEQPALQVWPSASNFIYLRLLATGSSSLDQALTFLTQELKELGTLVRHTGGGIRLTVGSEEENERSRQHLLAVLKAMS